MDRPSSCQGLSYKAKKPGSHVCFKNTCAVPIKMPIVIAFPSLIIWKWIVPHLKLLLYIKEVFGNKEMVTNNSWRLTISQMMALNYVCFAWCFLEPFFGFQLHIVFHQKKTLQRCQHPTTQNHHHHHHHHHQHHHQHSAKTRHHPPKREAIRRICCVLVFVLKKRFRRRRGHLWLFQGEGASVRCFLFAYWKPRDA